MTEDQIERRVERETDALDRAYMSGKFTRSEYERRLRGIDARAQEAYRDMEADRRAEASHQPRRPYPMHLQG